MKEFFKLQFILIVVVFIFNLSGCKTMDGYYRIHPCGGIEVAGCSYWQHESKMSEGSKLNAMTITERVLYAAKQENKNKRKKSNTTKLKKNIGFKEISVCKDSPIKISTYKNTFSFKLRGLPEWDNCYGILIEDNFKADGFGNESALKKHPNRYEGEWLNGQKTGLGKVYVCNDGSFPYLDIYHRNDYTRKYNIEKRQYTFEESGCHVYVGMVQNGAAHGKGIFYNVNGDIQIGDWKYNELISGKSYKIEEFNSLSRPGEKEILSLFNTKQSKMQITKNEQNSSNSKIPKIIISSSTIDKKKAIIKGKVTNKKNLSEFTINNNEVSLKNNGEFTYATFIPINGIDIVLKGKDIYGKLIQKSIYLERDEAKKNQPLSFAKLNPLKLRGKLNKNALALVIGVNEYKNTPNAIYADNDAYYFADFSENILGINAQNIKLISNKEANINDIKKALKIWMKGYSTPDKSDIYIFFAGHGLASTDGKELYLLPYDGEPRLLEDTALLRSEIFNTVKSINPKSVTVFLDACYSGQTREKNMILADARPIAIVPIENDVPNNFAVFSASSGSEISGSLPEANHGLFSYFLMKGLEGDADANNDKKITNGEMHNYVRSNVTRQAVRLGREQTPQLQGDENRVLVEFN